MKQSILILTCSAMLVFCWLSNVPSSAAATEVDRSILDAEQKKGENLVEKLGITETLGPLAPVALSPFFGLTCLSATSMLCEKGVLPENDFLMGNEVLNNGWVFLIFLGLTVITSAPRLLTASKVFAEATERIETYAGIISYGIILMAAQQNGGSDEQVVVYAAGFFSMTGSGLLACCAAVNIFVIATVRFFFELLTLISPIPTLDAIFEGANKSIAGILAVIYAYNPWLAFVLNVILFLICLVIFKWVNRRLRYMKSLLLEPIWVGTIRRIFGRSHYDPDFIMQRKLGVHFNGITMLIKCFPLRKLGRIKKKDRCYLLFHDAGISLVKPRLLKNNVVKEIPRENLSPQIQEGLLSYSLILSDSGGGKDCELIFGGVYTKKLDAIRNVLSN